MLVLGRKINEVIHVGDDIRIVLISIQGNWARIGVEAPNNLPIVRGELKDSWRGDTRKKGGGDASL